MKLNTAFIFVFSVFVVGAFSDDSNDLLNNFKAQSDECIAKTNVDPKLVESLLKDAVFTEDKNLKCFIHCLHVKIKFINENGVNFHKLINDFEDKIDKEAKNCYKEFNMNRASLDEKLQSLELPNERNLKCFMNCVITHLNIFDKNGMIALEKLRKYLDIDKETQDKIYTNCKDIQGADDCEKFFEMSVCIRSYFK
ncbi:hypothetical protein FQR65_LT09973 [Abscondita terminalis]|nr:hypothetical protein FQR65_LT09973 [Abscondita terminalis]